MSILPITRQSINHRLHPFKMLRKLLKIINIEVFVPMKKGRYQSILIWCILLVDQWIVIIKALLVESVYILILCCVGVPAIMSVNIGTGMTPAEEDDLLDLPEYEETLPSANKRNCTNTAEETVAVPG